MAKPNRRPHRKLFALFRSVGYNRYAFEEIPNSRKPVRLMHYYRKLWKHKATA